MLLKLEGYLVGTSTGHGDVLVDIPTGHDNDLVDSHYYSLKII
jgi:hypothetical protein